MTSQDNNSLSRTLQQSLQDVLMEVSLDGNGLMGSSGPTTAQQFGNSLLRNNNLNFSFSMPGFGVASRDFSSSNHPSSTVTAASALAAFGARSAPSVGGNGVRAPQQLRPSEALGMSTEELLLAAATEQRMLEETEQRMLEETKRVVARQQALAEKTLQSRRLYNESLLALMKGSVNNICNSNNALNCNTYPSGFSTGIGGGMGGGNGLLQQGFMQQGFMQQLAKQAPPVVVPATMAAAVPPLANNETKTAIKVLGTSLRKKDSPYLDVSALQDPDISDKRTRGGVTEPFPEKLHRMLDECEKHCKDDIISFFSHGRAFAVHDPDRFIAEVMPKYFKQSRLSSFQRQLNLYGFTRVTSGPDAGGYYHELFLKGRPNLAVHMRRVGLPKGEDRRKMRAKNLRSEPNFYAMGNVKDAKVNIPGLM